MRGETDREGMVRKRRLNAPVWVIAAVGVLVVALGASTIVLASSRSRAKSGAARLAKDHKALADALELHRSSSVDLDAKLKTCSQDLDLEKTTLVETGQKKSELEAELVGCRGNVKNLKEKTAELSEFKSLTARFQKMISAGRLNVEVRRGKMVVKLPDAILFPSGKAVMSDDGKEAIAEVAGILKQLPGRRFTVAGHTDNLGDANWELSTARAVTVTELLVKKGITPSRLVAAGYSEHDPIASNASASGRQKNRRIEIVLEPDLGKVAAVVTAVNKKQPKRKGK